MPSTRQEKEELKNMIQDSHNWEEGELEENFNEALRFVNTCIASTKIPSQVQAILNNEKCINLTLEASKILFFHIAKL